MANVIRRITNNVERTNDFLDSSISTNQRRLQRAITDIENRLINDVRAFTTTDAGNLMGPKVNLKKAQRIHKRLTSIFDDIYGATARSVVNGYDEAADFVIENLRELDVFAKFTDIDKNLLNTLKAQNFEQYLQFGAQAQELVAQSMYNSIAGGAPFSDLVVSIRGALTGHIDALGRPMTTHANLWANDGLMNFYNQVHIDKARSAGLRSYLYYGDIIATSRPFCKRRAGKVFTERQIKGWRFRWKGKSGPAMTHRGGWNCRHHWHGVKQEWIPEGEIEIQEFESETAANKAKPKGKEAKSHNIPGITPRTPIDKVNNIMREHGYRMGAGKTNLKTGVTSYRVTTPTGNTISMTGNEIIEKFG